MCLSCSPTLSPVLPHTLSCRTHTHTHTHTRTITQTHVACRKLTHTYSIKEQNEHKLIDAHTFINNTHTHTHTHTLSNPHTHTHIRTSVKIRTHAFKHRHYTHIASTKNTSSSNHAQNRALQRVVKQYVVKSKNRN